MFGILDLALLALARQRQLAEAAGLPNNGMPDKMKGAMFCKSLEESIVREDKMAWKKNSPEAVRRFDELVPVAGAERSVRFGCPGYALQGQRYASLHEDRVILRLSAKDVAKLLAEGGALFEPLKGRPMKDRVVLPEAIAADAKSLRTWVGRAARHAGSG